MKLTYAALALGALQATAAPSPVQQEPEPVRLAPRATPTLYLAGDSTMAKSSDTSIDGWGNHISKYTTLTVVNNAIGGRSARSFFNEGRFQGIADKVKAGDIVVIEFGHNDGGSPTSNDNGRSACGGSGTEVCVSDKTGEKVYTFPFYLIQGAKLIQAKGGVVIFSSTTPNNNWEGGSYSATGNRFVDYAKLAATTLGTSFVDHYRSTAKTYFKLGNAATNALYPNDHTHTSPTGADWVAKAFAQSIAQKMNGTTPLAGYIRAGYPIVY